MVDFSGMLPKQEKNGLFKFNIQIDGLYEYGEGFISDIHQRLYEDAFLSDLEGHLSDIFNHTIILKSETPGGVVDTLENKLARKCVYLHPMEFFGYLEEIEIENLTKYINNFFNNKVENIHVNAYITDMEQFVWMTDMAYEELLIDYSSEIIKRVQDYYNSLSPSKKKSFKKIGRKEIGMNFARYYRIPRDTDRYDENVMSSDIDVCTINNIIKVALKTGMLKLD